MKKTYSDFVEPYILIEVPPKTIKVDGRIVELSRGWRLLRKVADTERLW